LLPEIKIVLYILFVISLFVIKSLNIYLVFAVVLCVFLFKLPFHKVKSGWIPISLFLLFTFISNVINQHGKVVWTYGPFLLTEEGMHIAAVRTLRLLFMIAGAKILIGFTSSEELVRALGRLLSPLERIGLPVKEFIHTMGLTMKCFPALKEMAVKTYKERRDTEDIKGFWGRVKAVSLFLLPMFVKSMQSPETFFDGADVHEKKD
jgi:energy-coupling factor transport system permease protein